MFISNAITSDNLRKNIIDNYNDIIQSENQMQGKMNKSIALKLNKEIQKIQKNPKVQFISQAQKNIAMKQTIDPNK